MSNQLFSGFKIVVAPHMTMAGTPYKVQRTLKERLFSNPWRPLKKTRTVVPQIPSREVLKFEDTLVMHPSMAIKLKRQIKDENIHSN